MWASRFSTETLKAKKRSVRQTWILVCTSLIQALIANWEKMRNSSKANVQGSSFQREGLLKIENDNIL